MQRDKDKETHSVDIQFHNRHSQTFSKFVDDVHSENLVHVSSTNKELKYFLQLTVQLFHSQNTRQTVESLKQYQLTMFCSRSVPRDFD